MNLAVTATLLLIGVGASAMPKSEYFCQDDFVLTYGAVGQPMAVGTTISADGRLLLWDSNTIAGWFAMDATVTKAGQSSNGQWNMTFSTGTFKITSKPIGGTTYWEGSVSNLSFTGYDLASTLYDAAGYNRPGYVFDPLKFTSVGGATFTRTGGTWTDPTISMSWLGNYNWTYDNTTPETSNHLLGNLQARLVAPEPGSLAAMLCGLVGIGHYWRRKRS
jgi:hypothetical protein